MEKIFLYDSTCGKLRYSLVNNEVWFFSSDIVNALKLDKTVVNLYIKESDKKSITHMNSLGVVNNTMAINLYGIFQLISFGSMNSESNAMDVKNIILKNIIPSLTKTNNAPELSKEDKAILDIIHANTDLERAYGISNFKKAVTATANVIPKETKVDRRRKPANTSPIFKISNINDDYNLKRGQITKWFIDNGMFNYGGESGKSPQIKETGYTYLRFFNEGTSKRKIGLTEEGVNLVKNNIEDIRNVKVR